MSEIHYIERTPRQEDFCGCPPCPICYDPVITDDQQAPTFQQTMLEIYGEGPRPQNEQEYEWAHVAAHQCRQQSGAYFEAADRARMTQMQIDDLLKRAKKSAEAPKPLNRVNLDDMPAERLESATTEQKQKPAPSTQRQFQNAELQKFAYQQAMNQQATQTWSDIGRLFNPLTQQAVRELTYAQTSPGDSSKSSR